MQLLSSNWEPSELVPSSARSHQHLCEYPQHVRIATLFGYWQRITDFGFHKWESCKRQEEPARRQKPLVNNNIVKIETTSNRVRCSHKNCSEAVKAKQHQGEGPRWGADVHRRLKKTKKPFTLFGRLKVPSVVQQAQNKHRGGKKSRLCSRGSLLLSTHIVFIYYHYCRRPIQHQ